MIKVFCYFNLHKKCFSLKSVKTGRVIAHLHRAVLVGASAKVSEAGRQRVLRERRKNVHAGIVGYWLPDDNIPAGTIPEGVGKQIRYNPYKGPNFTFDDGAIVSGEYPAAVLSVTDERPKVEIIENL